MLEQLKNDILVRLGDLPADCRGDADTSPFGSGCRSFPAWKGMRVNSQGSPL